MITRTSQVKNNRRKGRFGEDIAARYLIGKNFKIIGRNFYIWGGEIDLIAEKDGIIVFVEVKLRSAPGFGEGAEALTKNKKGKLLRSVFSYLRLRAERRPGKEKSESWRLDLIDIRYEKHSRTAHIRHLPNILEA